MPRPLGTEPHDIGALKEVQSSSPKSSPTTLEGISEKRSRYSPEQLAVIDGAINAFRSTRKTNRIADGVILGEFTWWEGHTADSVVEGLRTYSEKGYAAEGKNERYARGIIRSSNGASARPQRSKKTGFPGMEDSKTEYLEARRAQSEELSR